MTSTLIHVLRVRHCPASSFNIISRGESNQETLIFLVPTALSHITVKFGRPVCSFGLLAAGQERTWPPPSRTAATTRSGHTLVRTPAAPSIHSASRSTERLLCLVTPGFGAVPRLPNISPAAPPSCTAQADAAAIDLGDASILPEPLPQPPRAGAAYLTTRPKKKAAFVAGAHTAAAVVKEVAELRRARDEATELAAALHGGRAIPNVSPRKAHPPPPPAPDPAASARRSPRRVVAAAQANGAASLQGAASRAIGLDQDGPSATLAPMPASHPRFAYSHDEPQPPKIPHVAVHAFDAVEVGIAAPIGYDSWATRTVLRGAPLESIVNGPSALVMCEVEVILEELGITAETFADAGMTKPEAERLVQALFVHSGGFLQMLTDSFASLPHRRELLKKVWIAFATLIERAKAVDGLDYKSMMTAMARDNEASYASLEAEATQIRELLQSDLKQSRAETDEKERQWLAERSRAEAGEVLAAKTAEERDHLRAILTTTEADLRTEQLLRAKVEARLEMELDNMVPLRKEAAKLAGVQAEAAGHKALAANVSQQLNNAMDSNKRLEYFLKEHETAAKSLHAMLALVDGEVAKVTSALAESRNECEGLAVELKAEQQEIVAMRKEEAAKDAVAKEKIKELREQMEQADAQVREERKARMAVEAKVCACS